MPRERGTPRAGLRHGGSVTQDALLAVGILMSSASQLRIGGTSIGPGELCLMLWLLLMSAQELARLGPPLTPPLRRILAFWVAFCLAQSLGTLTAVIIGDKHDPSWFLHDILAYPLIAAFSILSVVEPGSWARLRRTAWLFVCFGALSLAVLLVNAAGFVDLRLVEPWYWERLRGWSANPNQFALLCAGLALVALHLAETAATIGERTAAIACAILAVLVGRLTGSDTFTLMIGFSILVFLGLKNWSWIRSGGPKLTLKVSIGWASLMFLPLLAVSMLPLAWSSGQQPGQFALLLAKDSGKAVEAEADLRFQLWHEAINRGLQAWMLGLGPGPHLDIPAALVAARMEMADQPGSITHPEQNGAPNFEAHNTVLDLFVQGGILADLAFIWLILTAFRSSFRTGSAGLSTAVCSLVLFGMNNLIIRQPVFWFVIALCLVEEKPWLCRSASLPMRDGFQQSELA